MSTASLILLGLCAIIVQSSVVIVARQFLDCHHECPLSAISRMGSVTGMIFIGLFFLLSMFSPSTLQRLFALIFIAFLALFIYLDGANRY